MAKEELKEKAQALTIKNVTQGKEKFYSSGFYNGCLVGLEENEKRIEELEKQVKDLEWQLQEVVKDNDNYQAENKELKKTVEHYRKEREFFIGEVEK
ncbi:MAG: hypothetical protein VZQ58_07430 [Bacteroidales bacterium]|nr:hypothetical protein [Bacteroidales bacterium]